MVMRARVALIALGALASACTQSDQYLQFTAPVDVAGFIDAATSGTRTWTREALALRFGQPVRERQRSAQTVLEYLGLELGLEGDTLVHIALTDSRHIGPEGARVGYAVTHIRRQWGPPLTEAAARWTYQTGGALLVLSVAGGVVSRVEWRLGEGGR